MEREEKDNIKYAVLSAIAFAGMIALLVVAPNVIQILDYLETAKPPQRKGSLKTAITRSTKSLIKQGLIKHSDKDYDQVELTPKGKSFLSRIELRTMRYKKPEKWDKKWRVVIFDIKEKERVKRDYFRNVLRQVGFFRLQQSVWVFPYHIEPLVSLLKTDQDLGQSVIYMVVETIENDAFLKKHYDL